MKMRLKSVPLAFAKAGMKVGKSVLNPQGQVLLQEGTELTESLLRNLAKRYVSHISVHMPELRSEDELASERVKAVDRLNILFRNTGKATSLELLYQMILAYRLEKLT